MSDPRDYFVWSNEHDAWWCANYCGYTTDILQAGLYTKAEAEEIAEHADYRAHSRLPKTVAPEEARPVRGEIAKLEEAREAILDKLALANERIERLSNLPTASPESPAVELGKVGGRGHL